MAPEINENSIPELEDQKGQGQGGSWRYIARELYTAGAIEAEARRGRYTETAGGI